MKLRLKADKQEFNVPREVGQILLAALPERIEIAPPPEPLPRVVTQFLTWKLHYDLNSRITAVWVKCENCGMVSHVSGPTFNRQSAAVLHACCGRAVRWSDAPESLLVEANTAERKREKKQPNPEDERIRRAIATRLPLLPTEGLNEFGGETQYEGKGDHHV